MDFKDLLTMVETLGFEEVGGRGSHRVYVRYDVSEILTLQEVHGQAKAYQARQVAALIRKYNLELEGES